MCARDDWLWLKEQNEKMLRDTLVFYGVSEKELGKLVDNFPWLRDFFGLFQMACNKKSAQIVRSVLTSDGVLRLNELFFKEYGWRPLSEKKKRERHSKALLAVVDAPC